MDKLLDFLRTSETLRWYTDHDVKTYTTMGIGGKAACVVEVLRRVDLENLLIAATGNRIPYVLLGGGSNVVFADDPLDMVVIINRTGHMEKLAHEGLVRIDSGVMSTDFISWAIENRIGGVSFLSGVPGTIGGAAAVNAGAFGGSIDKLLKRADIFSPEDGTIKTVDHQYFQFQYRNSKFKYGQEVILTVYLAYEDEDPESIRQKSKANLKHRIDNHPPFKLSTAGCFFKNPIVDNQKLSAGNLIETTGFKGTDHQRLSVSHQHANFIINRDGGSFADIVDLEKKITQKVREEKGVTLEREVIYISPKGEKY